MNVRNITSCPTKLDVFRSRGRNLGCSVGNEYHCMLDEKKHHVELCISRSWIQPDHCPEYNSAANRIDVTSCDASEGVCPPTIYWSNTTFQYSGCVPEHEKAENKNESDQEKGNKDVLIAVVISAVVVFLLVILCTFLLCRNKRRRRNKKDTTRSPGKQLLLSESVPLEQLRKGIKIIQDHRMDGTYVPTYAAKKGREIFNEKRILIIQGITGSGKTKTALQIASEWLKEDEASRKCIYRNSFDDPRFVEYSYDNTCIVLDDCFTRWTLDSSSTFIPECCVQLYKQIRSREDMFLIITIDSFINSTYRQILHTYELFSEQHAITLGYNDFEEKKKILSSHLGNMNTALKNTSDTKSGDNQVLKEDNLANLLPENCSDSVGFPSVCWMFANIPECKEKGKIFFQSCEFILQKLLYDRKNLPLECSLYYALLRKTSEGIDTEHIDEKCLKDIVSECKYGGITTEEILRNLREEERYFTKGKDEEDRQNNVVVSFSQSIIYEICFKKWLSNKRAAFLRLCSVEQVKENIRDTTYKGNTGECFLRLKEDEFPLFASKFAALMKDHEELIRHPLLQNKTFSKFMKIQQEGADQREKESKSRLQNRKSEIRNESIKIENSEFLKDKGQKEEHVESEARPLLNNEDLFLSAQRKLEIDKTKMKNE